jgi:hypothetical protein
MTIRGFFRWVAWLLVLAVAVFTLSPIELRPVTAAPADFERLAAFALIGGAFFLGYPNHRFSIALLLIGIVGLLEFSQNFVPGRHGRVPDGLVKALGALLGAVVAMIIEREVERHRLV